MNDEEKELLYILRTSDDPDAVRKAINIVIDFLRLYGSYPAQDGGALPGQT